MENNLNNYITVLRGSEIMKFKHVSCMYKILINLVSQHLYTPQKKRKLIPYTTENCVYHTE